MTTRTYASPDAFKQAVEQRLRTGATGPRLRRSRQLLVYERFLARIVTVFGDAATLKGAWPWSFASRRRARPRTSTSE